MMTIVPYAEEYAEDVAHLVAAFRAFTTDGFCEPFRPELAHREYIERIERMRSDEGCEFLLLLDGDRPVGFLQIVVLDQPPFRTPVKERVGTIDAIFLLPPYRRRGWGKKLFEEGERRLIGWGVSHIDLDVTVFNRSAYAWYARMGYEVQHIRMSKTVR
ncbi:MAG: GNAT family N-acetyltransferase [Methanomicrobiaceae archaeon]|nr:GNAT family N-acetyltransferase [Methanomicrobiaceae archaeon]